MAQLDGRDPAKAVVLASGDSNLRAVCVDHFGDDLLTAKNDKELLDRLIMFVRLKAT